MAADEPLPGILAEVEDIIGREKTIRLAIQLGGREMHIPRPDRMDSSHPIAIEVGIRKARRIAKRYSGESVYVPHARKAITLYLLQQGRTVQEISEVLSVSKKAVRYHLRCR